MFFEIDGVADTNSSKELLLAKHDCLNVCTEAVRAAQTQGLVAVQADALTVSHVFWAGAHGLVSLQIGGQLVMGRDLDALISSMIATLKTGASNAHLNHFIYSRNQP